MPESQPDLISRIKRKLRQNPLLSYLIGCPYPAPRWNRCVKQLLHQLEPDAHVLDLGAGNRRRAPNVINLEIEATPEIDILADGHLLPFKDNTFDAVISEAVLEHVYSPDTVVSEVYRVLKPGGYICVAVPFLQGYHALPARLPTLDSIRYCATLYRLHRNREWRVCRSDDRAPLDLPRIRWTYLFFWEPSRRKGGFIACRMVNISVLTLRPSVIPTQACPYFGISRLFFRKKTVMTDTS